MKDIDLAGHERQVYLCKETQGEDFSLVTQSSCINIIDKFQQREKKIKTVRKLERKKERGKEKIMKRKSESKKG